MIFENARFDQPETIKADVDGVEMFIPVDNRNRFYRELVEQGVSIAPYVAPAAPVPNLSFAQLVIGIVQQGWVTEAEGDAWLEGRLPATVRGVIQQLPQAQRFVAKAKATRPSVVERNDPLVAAMAAAQGVTEEELDAFFRVFSMV